MAFGFGKGRKKGKRNRERKFGGGGEPGRFGPVGSSINCICPQCGLVTSHQPGLPCFQTTCPHCGSHMTRRFF